MSAAIYPAVGNTDPDPNTVIVFWLTNVCDAVVYWNDAVPLTVRLPSISQLPVMYTSCSKVSIYDAVLEILAEYAVSTNDAVPANDEDKAYDADTA